MNMADVVRRSTTKKTGEAMKNQALKPGFFAQALYGAESIKNFQLKGKIPQAKKFFV
ncbi:MAG: hypothetical protein QME28_00920 [Candidatus Saccharicenans sp.]|nr:hypothetical protein [Candidatus Saccharicenans sp.]